MHANLGAGPEVKGEDRLAGSRTAGRKGGRRAEHTQTDPPKHHTNTHRQQTTNRARQRKERKNGERGEAERARGERQQEKQGEGRRGETGNNGATNTTRTSQTHTGQRHTDTRRRRPTSTPAGKGDNTAEAKAKGQRGEASWSQPDKGTSRKHLCGRSRDRAGIQQVTKCRCAQPVRASSATARAGS